MTKAAEKKIDTNNTPKYSLQKQIVLKLSQEIGNVTRTASDCYNYDDFQYGSRHSNLDGLKCWCPRNLQGIYGQFLEFDFHKQVYVGQIITQGKLGGGWVTKYKVEYFLDGEWRQGGRFEGNSDGDTKAVRETKIVAEKLRIFPLKFKDNIHLRADASISEDISQFNISKVVEENNARVISELDNYNTNMVIKYIDQILTHRISIHSHLSEDMVLQIQQIWPNITLQYYNYNQPTNTGYQIVYLTLINCIQPYDIAIMDYINEVDPELQVILEPFVQLEINDNDDLEEIGFLNEFKVYRLNIANCNFVKLAQIIDDLESLEIIQSSFENLDGIQNFTKLRGLGLQQNKIFNIDKLKDLICLNNLYLYENQISNLAPLKNLINLTQLQLQQNKIQNIEPLASLINLTGLLLQQNKIYNLEPLASLTNLACLDLHFNLISNLEPLSNLVNLIELYLQENKITEINALSGLVNLEALYLNDNTIYDVEPLTGLTNLVVLRLDINEITDVEPLQNLINLKELNLSSNYIKEFSSLQHHPNFDSYVVNKQK